MKRILLGAILLTKMTLSQASTPVQLIDLNGRDTDRLNYGISVGDDCPTSESAIEDALQGVLLQNSLIPMSARWVSKDKFHLYLDIGCIENGSKSYIYTMESKFGYIENNVVLYIADSGSGLFGSTDREGLLDNIREVSGVAIDNYRQANPKVQPETLGSTSTWEGFNTNIMGAQYGAASINLDGGLMYFIACMSSTEGQTINAHLRNESLWDSSEHVLRVSVYGNELEFSGVKEEMFERDVQFPSAIDLIPAMRAGLSLPFELHTIDSGNVLQFSLDLRGFSKAFKEACEWYPDYSALLEGRYDPAVPG